MDKTKIVVGKVMRMVVTQIVELSKSRSKIYIDYEFAFVLYKGELRLYGLAEGKEISLKDMEEIQKVVLPKRAKLRTMNLLQKRSYTEKQLRDKLREGAYPETIVEEAIAYVKSFGYVDDYQYALDYISCYETRKSQKKLEMELLNKGISKENITKAFLFKEEVGEVPDERKIIDEILAKKQYNSDWDSKEKNRLYGYLYRRGFSQDKIWEAMKVL